MSDTVNIFINGKSCAARKGEMLIQVADREGIPIPRFCYHEKLPIAANCRMCLVDVERAPKPLPACATPVMDGMIVRTQSERALNAQKAVMEFLLINHPLDCPICDQGGECELQDVALGYGRGVSRFVERKRVVADKNIGPLIATEMTRCIHCTRCIRTLELVGGYKELGATGRGENTRIGTYIERSVDSEMSGNVIDVCPVGALTSKPFRYRARVWELTQHAGVAPHDCIGSNVSMHSLAKDIQRVIPRMNEDVNEVWLSDRDRFSYEALNSDERLLKPMVKENGKWRETEWESALHAASQALRGVVEQGSGDDLGCLISPSATVEEMVLAQKLMRAMGSNNIDHRLRQSDFSDDAGMDVYPSLGLPIAGIENLNAALLIGSNLRKEQPIAAHRLRKAAVKGAAVHCVNPVEYDFNMPLASNTVAGGHALIEALEGLKAAAGGKGSPEAKRAVEDLQNAENAAVIVGALGMNHAEASKVRALGRAIADATGASFGYLTEGANAAGAWLSGAVPHRGPVGASVTAGKNASQMLTDGLNGYLLIGVEPGLDSADAGAARRSLAAAGAVVAITAYASDELKEQAHVLLPAAAWGETSGTFVNAEGRWQSFNGAVAPKGEARPAWKILRVLGNLGEYEGFEQMSSEEVRDEIIDAACDLTSENKVSGGANGTAAKAKFWRIGETPIYAVDMQVRRAGALQHTGDAGQTVARLNSKDANDLGLGEAAMIAVKQGDARVVLRLEIDDRIASGCVWVPTGVPDTASLGAAMGPAELERA
ncbi:MAG: NADH-quinone oxidoreductase subunit G [Chromatiales bacterium]|nr:NADH-quinone oxidoreductase subunit G [Gammaproteobacteria bacterium]MCP5352783.1 NADH-quinone oxidoreductase subunit G [Chromatiales bacterium]